MGFWGGTGFKSAITGGLVEHKVMTSPEEKELTFQQKENYKTLLEKLVKQRDAYLTAEAENLNFGRTGRENVFLPDGSFFYTKNIHEYSVPTKNAENYADHINNMKAFKTVTDSGYKNLSDEHKIMVNSAVEDMGRWAIQLNNANLDLTPKDSTKMGLKWDVIFPEMPLWFRDILHGRIKNDTVKEEDQVVSPDFIEEAVFPAAAPVGSPLYGEKGYGTDQMHQEYSQQVLNYVKRQHPSLSLEPKDQPHIEKKYEVLNHHFPQKEKAAIPLVDIYLPPSKGGKASPEYAYYPSDSQIESAWKESRPYIYSSLIGKDKNNPRVPYINHAEEFHLRGIEVFESLISNDDLYYLSKGIDPNVLGFDHMQKQGRYTAVDYRTVVDSDALKIHRDKASAWSIWKDVHETLMYEFTQPLALGGKAYELLASMAHIISEGPTQLETIVTLLRQDKRSAPFADWLERLGPKVTHRTVVDSMNLTEGDIAWIMAQDKTVSREDLTSASMKEAYHSMTDADGKFDDKKWTTAPTHVKLLASVAKQRSLTLMGTYLAAAIIQGEGGKAISDHDQRLTEKILQYNWFTTPEQRIASLTAINDILAVQGVISDKIANANNAETIWAAMEYRKVARSRDLLEANMFHFANDPENAREDIFPVDENGDLLPDDKLGVEDPVDEQQILGNEFNFVFVPVAGASMGKEPKLTERNISGYIARAFDKNNPRIIVSETDLTKAHNEFGWIPTEKDLEYITVDEETGDIKYKSQQ